MSLRDAITAYRPPALAVAGPDAERADGGGWSLVGVCWRRKWTVMAMVVVLLAAAAVYLSVAQKQYSGRARLYVPQNGPRLLAAGADPSLPPSDAFLFRQGETIKAEPILKDVLAQVSGDCPTLMASPNPMGLLQRDLSVNVSKKDEIIAIEFTSPSPDESADVVNATVAAYKKYTNETNQSGAANMLKKLRGDLDREEAEFDKKQAAILTFKKANGESFFTNDRGMSIVVQNLATIGDRLTRIKLEAAAARAAYATANNKPAALKYLNEIERQAKELEQLYKSEKADALRLNDAQAELQKMETEAKRNSTMIELLAGRIKELGVTADAGGMNIQVLEEAKAETKPTSPKKAVTLLAAMALGLTLGAAAAVAHEALDQRVHAPDDAGRLLGLPVLGVIPIVRHAVASARKQLGRAVHLAPNSDVAEAYRTLRAAVYYGWPDRSVKSVLVTSPDRGDGKSTTASNLAIAMAQAGLKTLLIDADLRAAVQHKVFDVPNTAGLSDIVSRGADLLGAIRPSEIEHLDVLPSGTPTPAPAEITNSQAFGRLLQQLEAAYDLVVIDSPPLMAGADARILGAQAGLTILTARADKTTRQGIKQACQQLLGVGSSILGVVLNGVVQRRRAYAYGEVEPALESKLAAGRVLPGETGGPALTY